MTFLDEFDILGGMCHFWRNGNMPFLEDWERAIFGFGLDFWMCYSSPDCCSQLYSTIVLANDFTSFAYPK